ncbi:MAG: restriction endonuclease subunit S [Gammaproteobacteria bacterium]
MELKPGYKQTEVGVIPEEWEVKALCEIAPIATGNTPPTSVSAHYGNEHLFVSPADLGEPKYILDTEKKLSKKGFGISRRFPSGSILFTCIGSTIGKCGIASTDLTSNQQINAIFPTTGVCNEFLYYELSRLAPRIKALASEQAVPIINKTQFGATAITLPSLPEQRAIAGALGDVDALLGALTRLIAKKRDLKQAAMQQLLTGSQRLPGFSGEWEVKRFDELFRFLNTANNPRADLSEFGDVGYIHYGDIHTSTATFLDCAAQALPLIAKNQVANIPLLQDGDLVMADASEDYEGIGKCMEIRNATGRRIVAGLHTFLLRGNRNLLADGFKGYLQFIPSVKAALVRFATGISVYGISKNNVRSIEVLLPSIEEQTAIAAVLSDMDAELAALEARLDKTRALNQGMMQELLTGKTRLPVRAGLKPAPT